MQKKLTLSGFFFLVISLPVSSQGRELAMILTNADIPAIQLIYFKDNRSRIFNLGVLESGTHKELNSNTIFQAASLSKPVFAYAVLRLYDRGTIHLDTPLLHYAPYQRFDIANRAFEKITARMVLRHTTGLPNWGTSPSSSGWVRSPLGLRFTPDSCFSYSGEGFAFLQYVVEKVMNKTLNEVMKEEVFIPLKMTNSSYLWEKRFGDNAALGHNRRQKPTGLNKYKRENAAFSLLTTGNDYTLFLSALMNGDGLKPETHKMMLETQSQANRYKKPENSADPFIDWGLGVGLEQNEKGKAIWHWGDNGHFKCFFMAFPEKKESLVYFTNSENGLKVTNEILNLFFGRAAYWVVPWLDY
jgi:CubicO group peptidase (beta-lactamase class C family)